MAFGVEVASLSAVLRLDDSQYNKALKDADSSLSGFDKSMQNVTAKWKDFGRAAQIAAVPIGLALGKGIADASAFETAMAEISARTGLVGDDLTAVRDKALQMGADTMFSSQQAADGMLQLLTSGDSMDEAMQRIEHVMSLATIGGLDLGTAADGLTDIMAAMGLEVADTKDTIDIFAMATGASSATVQSLIDGFSNVGPVARTFGLSAYDTAATLATLSENGVKGSEAGTALKSMLLNLQRPTEDVQGAWAQLGTSLYDANGNARDFNTVLLELDAALDSKTPQEQNELMQTLAGSYGIVALAALRGAGGIGTMQASMQEQAQSTELVEAKSGTFAFALDALGGSVETLNIKAFTPFMNDILQPFVVKVTDAINTVGNFAEANPELTNTVLTLATVFVGATAALSGLGMVINLVSTAIGALIATALSPLGLAIGVGALLVAAYMGNWLGFKDTIDTKIRPMILDIIKDVGRWVGVMNDIKVIIDGINSGKWDVGTVLKDVGNAVVNEINTANPNGILYGTGIQSPAEIWGNYRAAGGGSMTGNNGGREKTSNGSISLLSGSGAGTGVNIGTVNINATPGTNGTQVARDFQAELTRQGRAR